MDRFNDESVYYQRSQRGFSRENLLVLIENANANDEGSHRASHLDFSTRTDSAAEYLGMVIDIDDVDPFTGGLGESQKARIADLLGRWEEPGRGHVKSVSSNHSFTPLSNSTLILMILLQGYISVGAVLQFRRALGKSILAKQLIRLTKLICLNFCCSFHGHSVSIFGKFWTC